jgi:hypothetical protein
LAGVPSESPDSLLISIVQQFHQISGSYDIPPIDLFNQFRKDLRDYLSDHPTQRDTIDGIIQAICDRFNLKIIIYALNDRHIFIPSNYTNEECFVAQIHWDGVKFDGVLTVNCYIPQHLSSQRSLSNYAQGVKICSWNLNGATSDEKRVAIDFELSQDKISLAGVQESHLRTHKLRTLHYTWVLGPQYQERASRGLGFIIENKMLPYVLSIKFPTPNIGYLIFKLPTMRRPCAYVNVHKHNEGSIESSLETGNKL